ncbi:hypothetical protein AMTR_s00120p00040080 [Amborella trichopoda]|uniref:Uncharacterized protein n=1 Tax=Amborella trichopoda TaxID=13333 RepID=W1NTS3_AMBTC|nr:hypothetical protein AMTR_s00120p00040080 [Amborella trichopoda]
MLDAMQVHFSRVVKIVKEALVPVVEMPAPDPRPRRTPSRLQREVEELTTRLSFSPLATGPPVGH